MPATASLIKGFLPVRLKLSKDDETFFYVKEHQSGGNNNADVAEGSNNKTKPGCTLFVVNAPIVPGVSTKLALRSLLGRYADISRVTVIPNRRHISRRRRDDSNKEEESLTVESLALWSDKVTLPTFLPPIYHGGKYAHVVFASPKGLKKTMQELHRVMSSSNAIQKKNKNRNKTPTQQTSDGDDGDENDSGDEEEALPCLTMDRLEIQTLADETLVQYERQEHERRHGKDSLENGHDDDDENFEDYDEEGNPLSKKSKTKIKDAPTQGALAVAKRYRDSSQSLSRAELLAECNRVMGEYEQAEQAKRKAHQEAKDGNMVDDDGFVTVSYSSNTAASGAEGGIHNLLEESITSTTTSHSRRNAAPRRRNNVKKNNGGTSELQDFYRFQRKEYKKRTLDQLRTQFEDDLRKIKKMKEGHQYRPFGR